MVGRVFAFKESADYPEVAVLFRFARKRLQQLNPQRKIKAIDVGRLLGFDYKYTHQFSHGKMRVFNIHYISILSDILDVKHDIIVRLLRRDIGAEAALDWCRTRTNARTVKVTSASPEWRVSLTAIVGEGEPFPEELAPMVRELWRKSGEIANDPVRLREFVHRYAGGTPADKAVVELLKKPKLALSRKGK